MLLKAGWVKSIIFMLPRGRTEGKEGYVQPPKHASSPKAGIFPIMEPLPKLNEI